VGTHPYHHLNQANIKGVQATRHFMYDWAGWHPLGELWKHWRPGDLSSGSRSGTAAHHEDGSAPCVQFESCN